jgi:hypothetical protein
LYIQQNTIKDKGVLKTVFGPDIIQLPEGSEVKYISISYVLLPEALQLQRNFGLLNEFFPFGSVSDAVLPVVYSHVYYVIFTSSSHLFLGLPSGLVDMGVHVHLVCYSLFILDVRSKKMKYKQMSVA